VGGGDFLVLVFKAPKRHGAVSLTLAVRAVVAGLLVLELQKSTCVRIWLGILSFVKTV